MKAFRFGIWALAAVCSVIFITLYMNRTTVSDKTVMMSDIGGPFKLASSNGGSIDSKDLLGKTYGVFFGFTHCPEVCPTTMYEMTKTLKEVGDAGKEFRLFFITVDPERDTAPVLKDYLLNFDPRIEALVPTAVELPLVAKQFHATYEKVPGSDGEYTMNHTATIYLMGRDGQLAGTISYNDEPDMRIKKMGKLLKTD